jgi:hypothetical protein
VEWDINSQENTLLKEKNNFWFETKKKKKTKLYLKLPYLLQLLMHASCIMEEDTNTDTSGKMSYLVSHDIEY